MASFQKAYWNGPGSSKNFTHPVNWTWLENLEFDVKILDYGCGYGRLVAQFQDRGFRNVIGIDPSEMLVKRGYETSPKLNIETMTNPPKIPEYIRSVGLTMIFAVLTCVPKADDQNSLMNEIWRITAPGGLIYVSDNLLTARHSCRYRRLYCEGHSYGTFATACGALMRHHTANHLRSLVGGTIVKESSMPVQTMNGGTGEVMQILAQKPANCS